MQAPPGSTPAALTDVRRGGKRKRTLSRDQRVPNEQSAIAALVQLLNAQHGGAPFAPNVPAMR